MENNHLVFVRALRTQSSERFLIQTVNERANDLAVVEIHYPDDKSVAATLIILNESYSDDRSIAWLVKTIDEQLLPMASLNSGDLHISVVKGQFLGQYANVKE